MASAVTNGQEPPSKKKTEPTTNPSLPVDLVVSCLARVSRLHYPSLSFVSKSFGSLLASPELYQTRSLLNRTESCLYVCLQYPPDPNPRWFTLCLKPNKTLTSKKNESRCHLLVPISNHNSPQVDWSNLVAIGHNLYAISGPSQANVSFLDCRTNTWLKAPTLRLAHTGSGLDGCMYLPGTSENPDTLNCVEVFDTKTQSWKPVLPEKRTVNLRNMEGKIYIYWKGLDTAVALNTKEGKGEVLGSRTEFDSLSVCTIDNITYRYISNGDLEWSGNKSTLGGDWSKVEGLEGLPKFRDYSNVKLADYGGKIAVFWDGYVPASGYKEKMIWCAKISLEKRSTEEIWGKVEWFDAVLTVPKSYKLVCAVTATV